MEWLEMGIAEVVPEWSKKRLLKDDRKKETFSFESKPAFSGGPTKRLGRGLKDLLVSAHKSTTLDRLLKGNVKKG